jgi:pimeloyl-ACP methyl ester carboxylesterase
MLVFSRKRMVRFENCFRKAISALRRVHLIDIGNGVKRCELGCVLVLLLVLVIEPRSADAADPRAIREGTHRGAEYIISIPSPWNGGLVMYAHGYEGEGPGVGSVRASPLDFHLTERGYAWAASGYRSKGYRPDWFLADMQALRELFINEFGQPRWTIIHGQSMGGHVAVASLELHPGIYQGGLVECGVVDGVGLMDWLYAYTAAAEYFSAMPLLGTARPDFDALATVAWPTVMGTPDNYTERGRRFDSVVKHLSGGEVPFRLEGMRQRYLQNLNSRQQNARGAQEFARHADTRQVQYDIDPGYGLDATVLNRDVPRVTPSSGARSRETNPVFAEMTGKIQVPLLTIHETGDFRVPFRLQQNYRRRALAAGTAHLLVQRAVRRPGHCGIEGTVRERAFDDLVVWMERGIMPEGDDVLGDVTRLGLRWTPNLLPDDPARRP